MLSTASRKNYDQQEKKKMSDIQHDTQAGPAYPAFYKSMKN
jgi:hypothetical protein